jgi:glyoxylate/hydroxypyruvate reductase A
MINILFSAKPAAWHEYCKPLRDACAQTGMAVNLSTDHAPDSVDYIVFTPNGPVTDFTPYTRTKGVLSLWAGVETVVDNATLTQPLVRMVDDSLTAGMVEWVVGHTMRHHLGMDTHILHQNGAWNDTVYPPLAHQRPVTILGLGALGTACGQALTALGFPVTGWSRGAKNIAGIQCLHGDDGLQKALTDAQIVILLLPDTPATHNTLNIKTLDLPARGAFVINPGRGPLIDDAALLTALDSGQIAHATLDVFRVEPLPVAHPYWAHPKVTVTPHIASTTRPATASRIIAANIKRHVDGGAFENLVDRSAGY